MTTPASSAKAAEDLVERTAGDWPAMIEQDEVVGEACDLVGCVADVDDRDR